jgi:hypothetical protein
MQVPPFAHYGLDWQLEMSDFGFIMIHVVKKKTKANIIHFLWISF